MTDKELSGRNRLKEALKLSDKTYLDKYLPIYINKIWIASLQLERRKTWRKFLLKRLLPRKWFVCTIQKKAVQMNNALAVVLKVDVNNKNI